MTSPRPLRNKFSSAAVALALLLSGCGATTAPRPVEEKAAASGKSTIAPAATTTVEFDPQMISDYTMGISAYKAGNHKGAESIFLDIAKNHPELPGPHANLGMIYNKKGEFDKAEVALNQALALKPDLPEVYNQLGILYRNKGQFDKALKNYQDGLKLAPDNPSLLINLGILYDLYLNRPDEALKQWQHYKTVVNDDKQVDIWIADINQRAATK